MILLLQRLSIWTGCVLLVCVWGAFALLQRTIISLESWLPESAYRKTRAHFSQTTILIIQAFFRLKLEIKRDVPEYLYNRPFVLVANHQSPFDIILIVHLFQLSDPHFVLRKGLEHGIPLFSYTARKKMNIILDQENLAGTIRSLSLNAKKLCSGHYIVIFPEGIKNSKTYPQLQPFNHFGLRVLLKNTPPETFVLPMTIYGTSHFFMSFRSGIHFGKTVQIKILPPIFIDQEDIKGVSCRCEEAIRKEYFKLAGGNSETEVL